MGRMLRSLLQSLLKLVNSVIGLAGMGMILYSLWMLRAWSKLTPEAGVWNPSAPWFIYIFLGFGVFFCMLTCSGHIAAETANGYCLSCYTIFLLFLVILEVAVTADIILNRNWEEDFPEDHSGKFGEFKDFVRSNFEICKWIGLSVVAAQALSILLAMVLRALGPERERGTYNYDSDDDSIPTRLPLLRSQAQNAAPGNARPNLSFRNVSWNVRIQDEINK